MTGLRALAVCALVLASAVAPAVASAQTPKTAPVKSERGAIYINGGYQAGTSEVQSNGSFASNVETATFTSKFPVKEGRALDAGARVRVWKHLSAGMAFTSFSAAGDVAVTGQIPHPFFFRTPRAVEGTAAAERKETAVHVRAVFTSAPWHKLHFTGFAGPAFFSVKQTLVDKPNYTEAYPFDSVTFTSATTRLVSQSKIGVGVGADVAYYFTKNLGVGVSATYSKITFDLKAVDDSKVSISAGGAIVGIGARIRF